MVALLVMLAGCHKASAPAKPKVGQAVAPAAWNLATPEQAVHSYLDWVSFSYRMANSDIPSATMTPGEAVRVDSYIELNKQQGQGIEQKLDAFTVRSQSEKGARATLAASEKWSYRYFSLTTLEYASGVLQASYDTTYTLVRDKTGWLVDSVEATSPAPVK